MRRQDRRKLLASNNFKPNGSKPPAPWQVKNAAANGVPVIELFGDIGSSTDPDPYCWYGESEGGAGTFKEFADALKAIGPVPNMEVHIHSYGGSIIVGKGMYDQLINHPSVKTAVIFGICGSAATYPAMACKQIKIPANSFMLIHNSTGCVHGDADDMLSAANMLEIADESIAAMYAARTGKSVEEILAIMDEDTWMTGTDAVALGLADTVIEPLTIQPAQQANPANFGKGMLNKMPDAARVWFDMRQFTNRSTPPTPTPPPDMDPKDITNLISTGIKDAFAAEAKNNTEALNKLRDDMKNDFTTTVKPIETKIGDVENKLTEELKKLTERVEAAENLVKSGVAGAAGGGAPVHGTNGGGDTDPAAPKNEAELRVALAKLTNHAEKSALIAAFKARK